MESVDNNQFEIKPTNSKRKMSAPRPNVFFNPGLDLLSTEDQMCNTAMEVPQKKRKRTKSCDITAFENSALDLGISKVAVNEFLVQELENVRRKGVKRDNEPSASNNMVKNASSSLNKSIVPHLAPRCRNPVNFDFSIEDNSASSARSITEPIYGNIPNTSSITVSNCAQNNVNELLCPDISRIPHDCEIDSGISVLDQKSVSRNNDCSNVSNVTNIQKNITNQVLVNNSNLSLSFIDRLALNSPNNSNQSLYFDDDLNESNIMEVKTITIITKKKRVIEMKHNDTNPFLNPNITSEVLPMLNPFLDLNSDVEYHDEVLNRPPEAPFPNTNSLVPKRLFSGDTNSTITTMNESTDGHHEYENINHFRPDSPIYENIDETDINKQSKILGCNVSQFSSIDIMNLNKNSQGNSSNVSETKNLKQSFLKAGNKLSKKVFKTLKKTFKHDKIDTNNTLNPYEVPRKPPKQKETKKESGIENPALNLDNSDDIEIEEISDEEHQYETIKTKRNTQLNMNVTPLRVRDNNIDLLHDRSTLGKLTPGKKVRFDSTLNQEKVITGNSFNYGMQSPGFDAKIDKYHDELENCINERKFLQQNM